MAPVSVRISASGDSLGLNRLPGAIGEDTQLYLPRPVFIRNNPDPTGFWALIPRDTVHYNQAPPYQAIKSYPLIVKLDTSGLLIDSFPVLLQKFIIVDAAFVTPRKILISGWRLLDDPILGQVYVFETAMVAFPERILLWQRSIIVNNSWNGPGYIGQRSANQIYLMGPAGTHVVAQALDTNGVQAGGLNLFTLSANRGPGGMGRLLPGGRFAYRAFWTGQTIGGTFYPGGTAIGVVDSSGREIWRREFPGSAFSAVGPFHILGGNQDGSILVVSKNANNISTLDRYSATGDLQTSWPLSSGDSLVVVINEAVYLGDDKAYVVGQGGYNSPNITQQRARYWAAYLDGTGNLYAPTAIRQSAGPRAQEQALSLYPNPATQQQALHLSLPAGWGRAHVMIHDAQGWLVRQQAYASTLTLEGLAAGVYQVSVSSATGIRRGRVLVR